MSGAMIRGSVHQPVRALVEEKVISVAFDPEKDIVGIDRGSIQHRPLMMDGHTAKALAHEILRVLELAHGTRETAAAAPCSQTQESPERSAP